MNYKIIGADQKEYGPVTTEQLRQWIAQGRANASTVAQVEGSTEWKPLSAFPEFAADFGGAPVVPPLVDKVDPENLAREIVMRDYNVDIGGALSRAWALMKTDFGPIVGVSALLILLIGASGAAYVGLVVGGPLMGGLFRYYLKKIRGHHAELGDAFSGFSIAFLQLFLGYLITGLLTFVGILCCVIPGIYVAVAWQFALPLIIEMKLDFWPAMELSRKVVSKHWWAFFGFIIVAILVNILGLLACGVGVFVSAPLTMIALMYLYEDIFHAARAPSAHAH